MDHAQELPFVMRQTLEAELLNPILKLARESAPPEPAGMLSGNDGDQIYDETRRRARIQYFRPSDHAGAAWLEVVRAAALEANRHFFHRRIGEMPMHMNLNHYDEPRDFIGWHPDRAVGISARRALSAVLLVAASADLEGGCFELRQADRVHRIPLRPGEMIVFPSERVHRVSPLVRGHRLTLNLWWEDA